MDNFARDVRGGLSASPKHIPSQYLYDDYGSELFTAITKIPEYYLTACENEILATNSSQIATIVQSENKDADLLNLIELGAGNSEKSKFLIREFRGRNSNLAYTAIDISEKALSSSSVGLNRDFPWLKFSGLQCEYLYGLENLTLKQNARNVILFLGSNIGNFTMPESIVFLQTIKMKLKPGDWILAGFDLKKNPGILMDAYNDPGGVTAQFNLNLLRRMNRELESSFNLEDFYHRPVYNPEEFAMKSYLVSKRRQVVYFEKLRQEFNFEPNEAIYTEHSQKYDSEMIQTLADSAGFSIRSSFTDSRKYFVCSLWQMGQVPTPEGDRINNSDSCRRI